MKAHSSQQQLRSASIPMSSSFLQMICLVVILMNVLTAFAGMLHYDDHFQRLPLHPSENDDPSIDAAQQQHSHRALQSSTIDYSGCYMDLTNADRDKNGFIEQQEYYTFLQSYGKRVCSTSTTVSLQQKSTFYTLACLCKQMDTTTGALSDQKVTSSDQCCLGNNAKLQTARDPITMAPVPIPQLTVAQKEYVKTVCFYTDASIPASVRDCGSHTDNNNDDDDGVDFPVDGDNNTTSSHSSGNHTNTAVDNDDSVGDDDYGNAMNDGADDHNKPKGTAACRLKSLNILENGDLTLRHYSDPIEESITVQLIYNSGIGWLGFGFTDVTKKADMIHNFAVIGLPETRKVQQYDLTGRSLTGVTPTPIQSLIRSTITQNGDQTVLTFTQAASEIGNIYNGTFQFIYAVGRNNELAYHTYRGSGNASFSVCDVIYSNETETTDDATEPNINATTTTSNTTETDDNTDDTEPESEVESMMPMMPSSSPTSSSIVSIVTSTSQVPSMSPTSLDNNNNNDDDDVTSPSMAPSGGKATTSLTTQPPYLRGTSAPSTMTSTEAPKVEVEGSTAKDIIEAFLNGKKGTDDDTDSSSPPPSPTAGVGQGIKNNTNETDNSAGMASFIRWLRTIWQFSKQPFISADKKHDR